MSFMKSRAERGDQDANLETRRPCRVCRVATLIPTLTQYGALCAGCFSAYCASAPTASEVRGGQLKAPIGGNMNRQWAVRLKVREQSGERLTDAQKAMWREALRHQTGNQS